MANIYYDKTQALGITKEPGFYAVPVEVSETTVRQVEAINKLIAEIARRHITAGFPRDAQTLADYISDELTAIMKTKRTKNVKREDTEQSD